MTLTRGLVWLVLPACLLVVGLSVKRGIEERAIARERLAAAVIAERPIVRAIATTRKSARKARKSFEVAEELFNALPEVGTARVAIAAADTALAQCDTLVAAQDSLVSNLRKQLSIAQPKPKRIVPYVEAQYEHETIALGGRVGVDVRVTSKLRVGVALESRGDGTPARQLVTGRWELR